MYVGVRVLKRFCYVAGFKSNQINLFASTIQKNKT